MTFSGSSSLEEEAGCELLEMESPKGLESGVCWGCSLPTRAFACPQKQAWGA